MRIGVYAVLAVVVGVMLVGLLPGQLSNFAAPMYRQTTDLQSGGSEPAPNVKPTPSGFAASGTTKTNVNDTTTGSETGKPNTNNSTVDNITPTRVSYSIYADLGYYSLLGVGFISALTVYLISKKILNY